MHVIYLSEYIYKVHAIKAVLSKWIILGFYSGIIFLFGNKQSRSYLMHFVFLVEFPDFFTFPYVYSIIWIHQHGPGVIKCNAWKTGENVRETGCLEPTSSRTPNDKRMKCSFPTQFKKELY